MERFMKHLIEIEQYCVDYFYHPPTHLSQDLAIREENDKLFNTSIRCSICSKTFGQEKGMTKYPYVDYSSGEPHGAIHLKFHEDRARKMRIPIFFHNFRGYDSHLVVRALGVDKNRKLDIIGQGMEKYLVIRWGNHIEFKDTLQFLSSSLDNLTKSLLQSGENHFVNLRKMFPEEEKFKLLLRKGVFPYDWVDDWK